MVETCDINSTHDIILIVILIITEILPFVHNAQANGVLHLIYMVLSQFLKSQDENCEHKSEKQEHK